MLETQKAHQQYLLITSEIVDYKSITRFVYIADIL